MNAVSEIFEGWKISLSAIRANKLRSGLTTLGIVIGIVTVTLMGTAIQGLNRAFLKSVSALGTDVLYLERFSWFINSHEEWIKANRRRPITLAQVKALQRQMTMAQAIAPVASTRQPVKYRNQNSSSVNIVGTTEQFLSTGGVTVHQGRFMSAGEAEGGRPVCVVGWDVATNLFIHDTALGKRLTIGLKSFEVIGVLEKQGSLLGEFNLDNQVFIPIYQFVFDYHDTPDFQIQVKAMAPDQVEEMKEELRGVMRKIRRVPPGVDDDFSINQQDQFINTFNRVAGTIASVGLFITGLSLFVGGIGIMNIMFVSVAERTREIGVRKAIGAKRRTILIQFLIEAATICLFGGMLALVIAYPLTLLISRFMPATMSIPIVALALGVSLVTGVAAGFFPAWRAACMNPVDALRSE